MLLGKTSWLKQMQKSAVRFAGVIHQCCRRENSMANRLHQLTKNAKAVGLEKVQYVNQLLHIGIANAGQHSLASFGKMLQSSKEVRVQWETYSL